MPPFHKQDFKYDTQARKALRSSILLLTFLKTQFGIHYIADNTEDKYGVDLFGYNKEGLRTHSVEIEVKRAARWRNGIFDFPSIHVSRRKEHLWKKGMIFIQFDAKYEFAIVLDSLKTEYKIEAKYTNRGDGIEEFISIHPRDVFIIKCKEGIEGLAIQEPGTHGPLKMVMPPALDPEWLFG